MAPRFTLRSPSRADDEALDGQVDLPPVYRRTARREQAREHLMIAITMSRDMDMRFWLDQAEIEMKALG